MKPERAGQLGEIAPGMFASWLQEAGSGSAAAQARAALEGKVGEPAPLFTAGWTPPGDLLEALEPGTAGSLLERCGDLASGRASVVVTGQQPGFLGGPLYTLYKIATTVELARRRTRAGLPTVPVFWSGDDDTDVAEAASPVARVPGISEPVRSGAHRLPGGVLPRGLMVGRLSCRLLHGDFLRRWEAAARSLGHPLEQVLREAVAQDWPLARLTALAWTRLFTDDGLIVLSGDDPRLHEAAADWTAKLRKRTSELADMARERGVELAAGGGLAQLDERSLRHPWYESDGERRLPLSGEECPAARLRPGVLMRSLVQDWLLRPAAVVIGPGEHAYLRQLEPSYAAMGLERCPLVPRLSATVTPAGWSGAEAAGDAEERARELADTFLAATGERLRELMIRQAGTAARRAEELASRRLGRWRPGLMRMLAGELRAMESARTPAWVRPLGRRQERALAALSALLLWGDDLFAAVTRAGEEHLELGLEGRWSAFGFPVPEGDADD